MRNDLLLLLLICSSGEAVAQQPHQEAQPRADTIAEITPDDAVRRGLEHNRRIRAARADADGARAAFRQVQAARLPALRMNASYRRLVGELPRADFTFPGIDTTFSILPVPRNQVQTEVSIEQPVFQGMRLRNQARAAEHEADAADLLADQEAADVALAVRSAYWNLFRAVALLGAAEVALARVEAHAQDVENLFDEGVVLRTDLLAARTRRSEVLLDRIEADNAVRVARLELNRLIGTPLDAETRTVAEEAAVAARTAPPPLTRNLDALTAQALSERPQLRALAEQVRALERQVGVARGAWLPEVSLVGRYIYGRPNPLVFADLEEFRGVGEAGVLLRWSVFGGGRRPAQTAQARASLEAAEARLEDAREEVAVAVARQHLEALRAEEALVAAAEHAEEAEESFRVVREQFEEGVVLSAQVLEAEQVQRAAEARRADAVAQHAIARAALLNALGRVW